MVGQNIGKYRVADRVGRGGMGTVYRAMDETLHREVAIKVLNAELNDPEIARRFRAEAITVARLSHPGIATIYELFQHEGQWLMVMEFVRGETLEHLVERMGPLSPQRSAEICMQALAALAHAHAMGVVHRDLKPANLMITETGSVKIMDFGIARVSGTEHLTNAGYMMGTPAYMAPEQVLGRDIDARADLYALGVVFYRLITKSLPFKGESPFAMAQSQVNEPPTPVGTMRHDLPPWVDQVIVRALAKNPEERFQSAVEFHEGFARCLAGLPLTTTYSSSAPTELLMTPARAMPTGSIRTPTGMGSGTYPVSQGPSSGAVAPAPNVPLSPTAQSGAVPVAAASNAGTVVVPPAGSAPASQAPAKRTNTGPLVMVAAGAVVIGAIGYGGWVWYESRRAQTALEAGQSAQLVTQPAGATDPAAPTAPPAATTTDAPPAPAGGLPAPSSGMPPLPGAPATSGGSSTTGAPAPGRGQQPGTSSSAPGATTVPGATAPSTTSASPSGAPPASGRGRTAVDDSPLAFGDLRYIAVDGRDGRSRDAQLTFGDGRIAVSPKDGGDAMAAMTYRRLAAATYVRARDPKWDPAFASPPENLNTPGTVLRRAAHWLVLQSADAYVILRLEDSNWERILAAVEARTPVKVARP